jgi:hypothetical protein
VTGPNRVRAVLDEVAAEVERQEAGAEALSVQAIDHRASHVRAAARIVRTLLVWESLPRAKRPEEPKGGT